MPETLQDYSKKAAESFVQTAVFIDDQIYWKRNTTVDTLDPPQAREPTTNTENAGNGENNNRTSATQPDPAEETVCDSYEIINSFATKKIVCSMYEPKDIIGGPHIDDSIIQLCTAADIVIVDWSLCGNIGNKAIELIKNLINRAIGEDPEKIRLVLVYTQEINLLDVANKIFDAIRDGINDKFRPTMDTNSLAFYSENYRVAVLGKLGRQRPDDVLSNVVGEAELADIAVKEFAKLAAGILQGATLHGLAEIRNNSRKILSRFSHDLDPAFLTHRAMALDTEDAFSHIVPLLVSEIESVLEGALPNPLISDDVLRDWCMKVWKPGDHLSQDYGAEQDYRKIAKDICTRGFKASRKCNRTGPNPNNKDYVAKAGGFLFSTANSNVNLQFGHFMASRAFYSDNPKSLTLGSVLKYIEQGGAQSRYILCIQPVCDCVRLEAPTAFIFAKLRTTHRVTEDSILILAKSDSSVIKLTYDPKSHQCFVATFVPNEISMTVVSELRDGNINFTDKDGRVFNWIGQLRPSHAQRAVEKFASNLSRVGLTESEWLRLLARR